MPSIIFIFAYVITNIPTRIRIFAAENYLINRIYGKNNLQDYGP